MTQAEATVVVPTHARPIRLRWLLTALEEQTIAPQRFEVVVAEDGSSRESTRLLAEHPLARCGRLRAVSVDPPGSPARQRNAGWRAATTPTIVFTDDDCRPAPYWLERLLDTARLRPDAVVEGKTRPDPDEEHLLHVAPHARSLSVDPPSRYSPTCNILYPRALLDRLGGFDEALAQAGEDTDLAMRAKAAGARFIGAPEATVWHAVDTSGLPGRVRSVWRWQHLALVAKKHPELRRDIPLGIFWKPSHARLALLLGGGAVALASRRPGALLLGVPWVLGAAPRHGRRPRALARSVSGIPGRLVVDAAECAALVRGSVRYRTILL